MKTGIIIKICMNTKVQLSVIRNPVTPLRNYKPGSADQTAIGTGDTSYLH